MEAKEPCPWCQSQVYVKNGFTAGRQRYRCRGCGKNFSVFVKGKSLESKFLVRAFQLYLEGVGLRAIERILGIGHVTVMYWIRKYGLNRPKEIPPATAKQIELDELFHFIQEKKAVSISGWWYVESQGASFLFLSEIDPVGLEKNSFVPSTPSL